MQNNKKRKIFILFLICEELLINLRKINFLMHVLEVTYNFVLVMEHELLYDSLLYEHFVLNYLCLIMYGLIIFLFFLLIFYQEIFKF